MSFSTFGNVKMGGAVLVTGGAGFIGSHVCEALVARGWSVDVLDNLSAGSADNIQPGIRVSCPGTAK